MKIGFYQFAPEFGNVEENRRRIREAVLQSDALSQGLRICEDLRRMGCRGEMSHEAASIKSQVRHADRIGARYCIFLGQEEMASGLLSIKDMATGEQFQREASALPDIVRHG